MMSMQEKQSQKVIVQATQDVHGNWHEDYRIVQVVVNTSTIGSDRYKGEGNGVFSF
jgi:hypothetical protein